MHWKLFLSLLPPSNLLPFSFLFQAPDSMKSVLQAAWLLTVAFGNLIVIVVAELKMLNQVSAGIDNSSLSSRGEGPAMRWLGGQKHFHYLFFPQRPDFDHKLPFLVIFAVFYQTRLKARLSAALIRWVPLF